MIQCKTVIHWCRMQCKIIVIHWRRIQCKIVVHWRRIQCKIIVIHWRRIQYKTAEFESRGDRACLPEPVFQLSRGLSFMEIPVLNVRLPLTTNETCGNVDHASAVYPNTKSTVAETVKFATTSLRCRSRWQRGVFVVRGHYHPDMLTHISKKLAGGSDNTVC